MKSLTEHLWFETPHRRDYVNITGTIEQLVRKSGVQEGLCLVNAMHITASVYINDAEDGLLHDYDVWLEKLAPHERGQRRCPHEAANHGPRGGCGHHQGQTGSRPLGTDFLRRIRWPPPQARARKNHRGMILQSGQVAANKKAHPKMRPVKFLEKNLRLFCASGRSTPARRPRHTGSMSSARG